MIVQGIGLWLPETKRSNSHWPESFGKANGGGKGRAAAPAARDRTFNDIKSPSDDRIARLSAPHLAAERRDPFLGVRERRAADPDETVARATAAAAGAALADAGLRPTDVDVVLGHANVPDYIPSNVASSVAREIGCRPGVLAYDIDAGCTSLLVAMDIARGMLCSPTELGLGKREVILILDGQLITRLQPTINPTSPIFGDGASAFVVTSRPCVGGLIVRSIVARTHTELSNAVIFTRGDEPKEPKWFQPSTCPNYLGSAPGRAAEVKSFIMDNLRLVAETVEKAAREADLGSMEEIDCLAMVEPRAWIPAVAAQVMGLREGASVSTSKTLGHMGGTTLAANLLEARRRGLLREGARVACFLQGAGFLTAAAILEVAPTHQHMSSRL